MAFLFMKPAPLSLTPWSMQINMQVLSTTTQTEVKLELVQLGISIIAVHLTPSVHLFCVKDTAIINT